VAPEDVAELARRILRDLSPAALDPGVDEATPVADESGFRRLVLPRRDQPEPWRSLRLLDAAALGPVLVVTFTWGVDDTIFVLPYDARDLDLDLSDEQAVSLFLLHHLEFTLGEPREGWEAARSTPLGRRLAVVRSVLQ
jgi:hypothetical protein